LLKNGTIYQPYLLFFTPPRRRRVFDVYRDDWVIADGWMDESGRPGLRRWIFRRRRVR
jgi:hypothetical protein